jgi:hypothetical protein
VFTDKPERNYHFPAPGRNCISHHQALQDFPDTSQVSLHKNNEIKKNFLQGVPKNDVPVTAACRFISERTVEGNVRQSAKKQADHNAYDISEELCNYHFHDNKHITRKVVTQICSRLYISVNTFNECSEQWVRTFVLCSYYYYYRRE